MSQSASHDALWRYPGLAAYAPPHAASGFPRAPFLVYLDAQRVEQMSAVFAVIAGLAILATGLIIFPRTGMKGLVKALAITTSLAVVAAFLLTAAHTLSP
jgi:hypothetical protein